MLKFVEVEVKVKSHGRELKEEVERELNREIAKTIETFFRQKASQNKDEEPIDDGEDCDEEGEEEEKEKSEFEGEVDEDFEKIKKVGASAIAKIGKILLNSIEELKKQGVKEGNVALGIRRLTSAMAESDTDSLVRGGYSEK
jgi:hypothetical protein